jgi:tetratricopeptide (TPR) repeat protein
MKLSMIKVFGATAAFVLIAGCAGTQKVGETGGGGGEGPGAGVGGDPLAAGLGPTQAEKRDITEDQQEAFDKAVARWDKARKSGTLKGECDSVASAFGKVADKHSNLVEARHNQAAILLECGKEADAVRIWEQMAGGPKPYAPALSNLGYLAWRKGDAARAENLFDRAVKVDPFAGSVGARLNLSQILRARAARAGSTDEKLRLNGEAINHLRRVLAVDGNNLHAYATLCYVYNDLNLLDMARLVGDQAIGRAEEIATGKFADEKSDLADADKSGAAAPAARRGRGRRGAAAAETPSGPKTSKEITAEGTGYTPEMKKSLGMVYNTLGLVWLKKKSVSQAIANFKKAIEMDPEMHESRMNLGALSLNYRDYKTAEENFRAVLNSQPNNYEAMIGLGVALRGNRKIDEAEQQYLTAQKLDPQSPDSYFNLGILYQEYKGIDKPALQKAQQYYRDFLGRARSSSKRRDAEKRIKDIDEMMVALDEAAKLQREAEQMQRKMEEQQKKMEEELKKMQELEKQQGGGGPAAAADGAGPAAAAK